MAFDFVLACNYHSLVDCFFVPWVKPMDEFNRIAVLNSLSATIVALLGIIAIIAIIVMYFKYLNSLKKDIMETIEKIVSKKLKEGAEIDRKKLNDEIIKKFMK